jgi:hypothetical protein
MKKTLIIALAIVMSASLASAQSGGHIGLFSDPAGTNCNLVGAFGLASVYVVHTLAPSALSSQFKVQNNTLMSFLGQSNGVNQYVGGPSILDGGAFTYVQCRATPWLITTLSFFYQGLTAPCSTLEVVADPAEASGQVLAVDCDLNLQFATGGKLTVNGNETCPCVETVSTEESSWSKIKAMYQ